jgi:hypothetical protein
MATVSSGSLHWSQSVLWDMQDMQFEGATTTHSLDA